MHKELFSIKRLVDLLIQFDVALKTIKIMVILNAYWSRKTKRRLMWIKRQKQRTTVEKVETIKPH